MKTKKCKKPRRHISGAEKKRILYPPMKTYGTSVVSMPKRKLNPVDQEIQDQEEEQEAWLREMYGE